MKKRKNQKTPPPKKTNISKKHPIKSKKNKLIKIVIWLIAASGVCTLAFNFVFDYLTGDVTAKYIEPAGRGYKFKLVNNSSTDQIIENFKITPAPNQGFIFKITEDVHATVSETGISLPGGNISYIPAYEFTEMDGYILHAKSAKDFRIPPLSSRSYMTPESMVVYVEYSTKSNNMYLSQLEAFLSALNIKDGKKKEKYLITNNYWTPISNNNEIDAIQIACRDDDIFSKSETCRAYTK
ncbi:hypothetical protein QDQ39_08375 [Providencia rettgeri]|uniref:hypothetical protein n=1 Tax=Providencia rettgeri TaxID=587 RepID=UPI00244A2C18|nr:hypothetical protein [Providencia rettgeri]MDH2395820.1 hypothetical protein [Providencia rettgeri]